MTRRRLIFAVASLHFWDTSAFDRRDRSFSTFESFNMCKNFSAPALIYPTHHVTSTRAKPKKNENIVRLQHLHFNLKTILDLLKFQRHFFRWQWRRRTRRLQTTHGAFLCRRKWDGDRLFLLSLDVENVTGGCGSLEWKSKSRIRGRALTDESRWCGWGGGILCIPKMKIKNSVSPSTASPSLLPLRFNTDNRCISRSRKSNRFWLSQIDSSTWSSAVLFVNIAFIASAPNFTFLSTMMRFLSSSLCSEILDASAGAASVWVDVVGWDTAGTSTNDWRRMEGGRFWWCWRGEDP